MMLELAGFAALAAGTHRAALRLFGRLPAVRTRLALLALGYALLAASLLRVLAGEDSARRLVEWFGVLTLCAGIVVVLLWLRGDRR